MGNKSGGLPYASGDVVESYTAKQGWTLYQGTSTTDKSPCTIFKFDPKNAGDNSTVAAQNALKLAKTMKHPNVVRCFDGIETPTGEIIIVTEPVVPLLDWLRLTRAAETTTESFASAVTLGMSGIVRALAFLNNDVSICHGLFSHDAVFVTAGGDWKVSRFDVAGKVDAGFLDRHGLLNRAYQCPARVSNDRSLLRNMPLHAIDAWSLGVLIRTVYGGEVMRHDDLKDTSKIPHGLIQGYQKLLKGAPEKRINVGRLVSLKHFQTPLVRSMLFLDEIMIKSPQEKFAFFQSLTNDIDGFPRHVCKYKVLPALTSSLSLGATSGETSMGVAGPVVLVPLLKLGQMLEADEYTQHITPVVLKMFEQQDRGIRVALLSSLPQLVDSIDSKLFNTKIFQHICTGFNDTAPQMREMTLKCLPILAPILETKIMDTQLKKVLSRSLQDPVPAIRTNATVCLGLLATKFPDSSVTELCLPSFTRALRDTFPHNRERALHSIKVTLALYNDMDLGTKVLPHVSGSLVDPVYSVRVTGFACVDAIRARLIIASEEREKQDAVKREELRHQTSIGSETVAAAGQGAFSGNRGGSNNGSGSNGAGSSSSSRSQSSSSSSSSKSSSSSGSVNSSSSRTSRESRNLNLNGGSSNSSSGRTSNSTGGDDGGDGDDGMWDDFEFDQEKGKEKKDKNKIKKNAVGKKSMEERRREADERRARMKAQRATKNKATTKKKSGGMKLGSSGVSSRQKTVSSLSLSVSSPMRDEDSSIMDGWGDDGGEEEDNDDMNDLLNFSDDDDDDNEQDVPPPSTKPKSSMKSKPKPQQSLLETTLNDGGGGWGDMDDLDDLLSSPSPTKQQTTMATTSTKSKKVKSLAERKAEREAKKKERDARRGKKVKKKSTTDGWDDEDW